MFFSTVRALQSQIADLKAQLSASEAERKELLNRLLARNNFEPIREEREGKPQSIVNVIAPFGVQPADIEEPMRESWIQEEAEWLVLNSGLDPMRARTEAEKRYLAQNIAIKLN